MKSRVAKTVAETAVRRCAVVLLYFHSVLNFLYLVDFRGFYDKRREKSGVGSDNLCGG
jgi:hypothetical protein